MPDPPVGASFQLAQGSGKLETCPHSTDVERSMPPADRLRRRDLPHWDVPHAAYFVTSCLAGSIPAQGLLDLERYRADLQCRPRPAGQSDLEWKVACSKRVFARTDAWLDQRPAVRHLADPRL